MNFKKFFGALVFAALAVVSCEENETVKPEISVSPDALAFEMPAGSSTVTVTANCDWEAVCDADWISVNPAKGSKGATVNVLVTDNSGDGTINRSAVVTFYGNNSRLLSAPVTVTQDGRSADGVTEVTVADFIKNGADGKRYRLSGKVSGAFTSNFTTFNLSDATGSILVYSFESDKGIMDEAQVENGATITLTGIYEYYSTKSQHEVTKAIIEKYEAPAEIDREKLPSISCAEFVKRADETAYYKLTGTVTGVSSGTSSSGSAYCYFFITDDDGVTEVEVYSAAKSNKKPFTEVEKNATVTVTGSYKYYKNNNNGKEYHEMVDAVIMDYQDPPAVKPVESEKVSDIVAASEDAEVILNNAVVAALSKVSFFVTDGKDYILVYGSESAAKVAVGDKVNVKGKKATYSSAPQISEPEVTVVSSGATVPAVTATDITSGFDSYKGTPGAYVKFTGTLTISSDGKYFNVAVDGATTNIGSLASPLDATGVADYNGKKGVFEGYYLYLSGSKYINIILTKIRAVEGDYFGVSAETIDVAAAATSASFTVSTNLAWTAESKTEGFSLDVTSGTGDKTVNVSFAANTDTENAKTATIEVKSSLGTKTVTIIQAKKSSGSGSFISTVTWTKGTNAYDGKDSSPQTATINGTAVSDLLKLGKSSAKGEATLHIPAGAKKLVYYALAWTEKTTSLVFTSSYGTIPNQPIKGNTGVSGNPPYTITGVTDADYYTIDCGSPLAADTDITVTTSSAIRVVLFGLVTE